MCRRAFTILLSTICDWSVRVQGSRQLTHSEGIIKCRVYRGLAYNYVAKTAGVKMTANIDSHTLSIKQRF